jgi:hypothetical protein
MAPRAQSYVLDPADYWELRARQQDVKAIEGELLQQRLEGTARLQAAQKQAEQQLRTLITKYQMPTAATFSWDDATRAVIATVTPTPPDQKAG